MAGGDTIFALSTPPGRSGIAVVRVSGPASRDAVEALVGRLPEARRAGLRRLRDRSGTVFDEALVLWFPGPRSETGEDVAEFHLHGGRAVVAAALEALTAVPGLRPAGPGEFTRRAVENGRIDLTQAEALADLIDAETEAQRRQALDQFQGCLARLYEDWRAELIRALGWVEAGIDFAEEGLPEDVTARARRQVAGIGQQIQSHLADSRRGELVREGIVLTLIGLPNSGKSSLLNALARRDAAIVAEEAGTTRDVIEVRLDLGGHAVTVADTAGLREAAGAVEAEGVRRALARAESADLVLLVLDGSISEPAAGLSPKVMERAALTVWNKKDLGFPAPRQGLAISAKTGEGIPELAGLLTRLVQERLENRTGSPPLTRARHRHALEEAASALSRALAAEAPELMAEDLRLALRALGRITGRVDVEEVLDVVFRDFCVGK